MVARSKRSVRENPLTKHGEDATATRPGTSKSSKRKKKLGTTRSVSSKTIKSRSSKSKSTKATSTSTSTKNKTNAAKPKKQMPKIKSNGAAPSIAAAKGKMNKGRDPSKPQMTPTTPRKIESDAIKTPYIVRRLQISTSDASEAEMSANPLSPSSKVPVLTKKSSTPTSATTKPNADQFQQAFGPRPSPNTADREKPTSGDVMESFAKGGFDSESFDHTQYSFISEVGTVYTIDNEVTFAMFLTDVKGFLVDKTGEMIPTGPEMVEMVEKTRGMTKGMVPESVKDRLNHTARVLDPRDISGGELLASAKEIGITTKDMVVEETVGCATWSCTNILIGFGLAKAATSKTMEKVKVEEEDEQIVFPAVDQQPTPEEPLPAEELPAIDPMTSEEPSLIAKKLQAEEVAMVPSMGAGESISTPCDDSLAEDSVAALSKEEKAANSNTSKDDADFDHVSIEVSVNPSRKIYEGQGDNYFSTSSKCMSAMTEDVEVDMKEALRQIKDLNAEMERLLEKGNQEDVALAETLKKRSKDLCKSMAMASSRAAIKTGRVTRAAIQTSKIVGQASSSIAKSSKKGIGSALVSTSKAMGSLGEKLSKSKKDRRDDATHTTGENSTLSSHSRSRSSRSDKSGDEKNSKLGEGIVLVSADSRMSRYSDRPPLVPSEI